MTENPQPAPSPRRHWFRRFLDWWGHENKCCVDNCSKPARFGGYCGDCIGREMIAAGVRAKRLEHQRLKEAVRAVLLEIEAEKAADVKG